jgi:hypothetical protein
MIRKNAINVGKRKELQSFTLIMDILEKLAKSA